MRTEPASRPRPRELLGSEGGVTTDDEELVSSSEEPDPSEERPSSAAEPAPFVYPIMGVLTLFGLLAAASAFSITHTYWPMVPPFIALTGTLASVLLWIALAPEAYRCVGCGLKQVSGVGRDSWVEHMQASQTSPKEDGLPGLADTLVYAWNGWNIAVAWTTDFLPAVVAVVVWMTYALMFDRTDDPEALGMFGDSGTTVRVVHYALVPVLLALTNLPKMVQARSLRRFVQLVTYVAVLYLPYPYALATRASLLLGILPRVLLFWLAHFLVDLDMKDAAKHSAARESRQKLALGHYYYISAERRFVQTAWVLWALSPLLAGFIAMAFPVYAMAARKRLDSKKDDDVVTGADIGENGHSSSRTSRRHRHRKHHRKHGRRHRRRRDEDGRRSSAASDYDIESGTHGALVCV